MRCLAVVVAALAGCAPTTTYGYQYRLEQQFGTGGTNPTNTDFAPWDYAMIGVGVPVLIGGIYAALHMKVAAPVDKVLCSEQHAVVTAGVVTAGPLSAEHTFTETKVNADAQEAEAMRADMLKDFIGVLTEVHGGKP